MGNPTWKGLGSLGRNETVRVQPNVITMSARTTTCEKGQSNERAWAVFTELGQCGMQPEVITYSALTTTCMKGGGLCSFLQKGDSTKPNVTTYSFLITTCENAFADSLKWDSAECSP